MNLQSEKVNLEGWIPGDYINITCLLSHHFMANRWGNSGYSVELYFWGSRITADGDCSHEIKRRLLLGRKVMTKLDSMLKSRHYFVDKGPSSQGYGFSSSHVWM